MSILSDIKARSAPKKQFRVIGFDTFSNEAWHDSDWSSKKIALEHAERKSGSMTLMYVFDDQGNQIAKYGTF